MTRIGVGAGADRVVTGGGILGPRDSADGGHYETNMYKWIDRYKQHGVDRLSDRVSTGRPREISAEARAKILALTRQPPPEKTGLSHWSSREMARYLKQEEKICVSHKFVATLWREHDLTPHRQRTFKLSTAHENPYQLTARRPAAAAAPRMPISGH